MPQVNPTQSNPEFQPSLQGSNRLGRLRPPAWIWTDIFIPLVASRLMLILVAWLSLHLMRFDVHGKWEIGPRGETQNVDNQPLSTGRVITNVFSRWDAGWYLSLSRDGYQFVPGQQSNAAFFPAYPFLVRLVHLFSFSDSDASWLNAGIVVSHLMLLLALIYLYLLVRFDFDVQVAQRSVLYVLIFPTTLFFSAVYTESCFLAVAVASVYHARRGQWWLSGLFAAAAVLTRSPGIVLALPLGLEYLRQRNFDVRKITWNIFALALIPLALAAFLYYMQWRFGNAFATRDAQFAWSTTTTGLAWPWNTVIDFFRGPITFHGGPRSKIDFVFTVLCFALGLIGAFRLPAVYSIYTAASFLFTIGWGSFGGMSRYSLIIFPIFVVLALAGRTPAFHWALVTISSGLAAFFMILFAHWGWVG
jgi:hypothetical protein